jgi:hypothetical protein
MNGLMHEYRLYSLVPKSNHLKGAPVVVVCQNDTEAIAEANKILRDLDIEVWERARRVIRIPSQQAK